jgi:hypothetical protein
MSTYKSECGRYIIDLDDIKMIQKGAPGRDISALSVHYHGPKGSVYLDFDDLTVCNLTFSELRREWMSHKKRMEIDRSNTDHFLNTLVYYYRNELTLRTKSQLCYDDTIRDDIQSILDNEPQRR